MTTWVVATRSAKSPKIVPTIVSRPVMSALSTPILAAVGRSRARRRVLLAGFVNAVAGRLVVSAADAFRSRHPGCAVEIREVQVGDCLAAWRC